MLVLTRNRDSGINIGPDIKVKILSIKRQSVKLGIEAPGSLRVWRDELAPLAEVDEEQRQPIRSAPSDRIAAMRIVLVVEDDPGHAKLIQKALCQQKGTMVTVADTAGGALDALGARAASVEDEVVQPDLILLDLDLPDGSGLDLLRTIRSVPELRTAPVVVLSCCEDETTMRECMEAGANAFVAKSANYDDFRLLVSRVAQFWAGDCLSKRSASQSGAEQPMSADDAAEANSLEAAGPAEEQIESCRGKRILLADDDDGHVTLIMRALRRANIDCEVDVVNNGAAAVDYLFGVGEHVGRNTREMPDLILLDLNMPTMTGRQVLQVLRNARLDKKVNLPPVVVLTSSDEETDINDSYTLGAQSFIRKPVHHGRFAEAVQKTTQYWLGLNESRSERSLGVRCPR